MKGLLRPVAAVVGCSALAAFLLLGPLQHRRLKSSPRMWVANTVHKLERMSAEIPAVIPLRGTGWAYRVPPGLPPYRSDFGPCLTDYCVLAGGDDWKVLLNVSVTRDIRPAYQPGGPMGHAPSADEDCVRQGLKAEASTYHGRPAFACRLKDHDEFSIVEGNARINLHYNFAAGLRGRYIGVFKACAAGLVPEPER